MLLLIVEGYLKGLTLTGLNFFMRDKMYSFCLRGGKPEGVLNTKSYVYNIMASSSFKF